MQTKSRSNGRAFSPRHLFSAAIHVCVHASPFLRKYTHHLWSVSLQSQIISCLVHRFQFFLLSLFSPPFISFCCIKSLGCVAIMGRAAPSSLCCRASIQPFHFPLWMHTVKKKLPKENTSSAWWSTQVSRSYLCSGSCWMFFHRRSS